MDGLSKSDIKEKAYFPASLPPVKVMLALGFLLLASAATMAQSADFLLLKRGKSKKKHIRFYPGEEISYKSKKIGYFVTDQIVGFDKDFIYLNENILKPEDILEIDIRKKDPRNSSLTVLNGVFLSAGVILLGVESLNSLVYREGLRSVDSGVAITSGILIGTGLALMPIRYKIFKNKGRNSVQIILMRID